MAHKPKPTNQKSNASLQLDTFGILMDALAVAQRHLVYEANRLDGFHERTQFAEYLRMRAERIADLVEECPDAPTLIGRLRETL